MELLASKFAPNISLKGIESMVKPSSEKFDVVEIESTIKNQRTVFLSALQNDHVCVISECYRRHAHRPQNFISSYGKYFSQQAYRERCLEATAKNFGR